MLKEKLKRIMRYLPGFRQRDNLSRQLLEIHEQLEKDNGSHLDLYRISRLRDDVLTFPVHDQEIHFYLPYAGYDYMQSFILEAVDFYEREQLEYCRRFASPDMVIVDAGANLGNHTVFFSKFYPAAKVYAFEPQNTVFPILERNLELNGCANVEAIRAALGETPGNAEIEKEKTHGSGETSFSFGKTGTYPVTTIDELKLSRCDFLKIDTEGAQLQVLAGGGDTIKTFHPAIWVEMHLPENFPVDSDVDMDRELYRPQALLKGFGYRLEKKLSDVDWLYVYDETDKARRGGALGFN